MAPPNSRNGDICHAWVAHVLLKGHNGGCSKRPSARDVYNGYHLDLQVARAYPNLHIRIFGRISFGLQCLVGAVFVYMDDTMGNNDALAKKDAEAALLCALSHNLLTLRFCIWNFVRTCLLIIFWLGF